MKFEDLLDEDGQGTRRCDAWLAENIEGKEADGYWLDKDIGIYEAVKNNIDGVYQLNIKNYTTGDSIDPIWELVKGYFERPIALIRGHEKYRLVKGGDYDTAFEVDGWGISQGKRRKNEQLAIAEALFKAYQKENN